MTYIHSETCYYPLEHVSYFHSVRFYRFTLTYLYPDYSLRIGVLSFVVAFAVLTGNPIAGALLAPPHFTWWRPLLFSTVCYIFRIFILTIRLCSAFYMLPTVAYDIYTVASLLAPIIYSFFFSLRLPRCLFSLMTQLQVVVLAGAVCFIISRRELVRRRKNPYV